jgi:hypothetical protein
MEIYTDQFATRQKEAIMKLPVVFRVPGIPLVPVLCEGQLLEIVVESGQLASEKNILL